MTIPYYPRDLKANEIRPLVGTSPHILEIGANNGDTTAEFLAAMPRARVRCYEPDPRPFARLQERFCMDKRVFVANLAIGSVNGRVSFHASHGDIKSKHCHNHDWDLSGSLRKPTRHLERSPEITFSEDSVLCARLDDVEHEIDFDFLWADAQGAQRDIIEGGRATIDRIAWIYCEVHDQPEYDGEVTLPELCQLLPNHEAVARYAENVLFRRVG